ncbi:MAG: hypothetical protein UT30_C0022G0004 [Candidatus Uhrbacteria bacterium GW2011_GWF2_39_13]|uniref:Uncharacterized protein n=1 Tax=Candidatus Uhrbacteria bacterium GW2011_GWF2_39_13 TaxID=1618995 RepID=A0A0G0MTD5_9BACT|nr:MAG: hypothetical protein UT30_C0022G0004 [Candidatus Uhrbacteria bacterium GW2011_GWF2_39_13]
MGNVELKKEDSEKIKKNFRGNLLQGTKLLQ